MDCTPTLVNSMWVDVLDDPNPMACNWTEPNFVMDANLSVNLPTWSPTPAPPVSPLGNGTFNGTVLV
jgi:hypothetical protein